MIHVTPSGHSGLNTLVHENPSASEAQMQRRNNPCHTVISHACAAAVVSCRKFNAHAARRAP